MARHRFERKNAGWPSLSSAPRPIPFEAAAHRPLTAGGCASTSATERASGWTDAPGSKGVDQGHGSKGMNQTAGIKGHGSKNVDQREWIKGRDQGQGSKNMEQRTWSKGMEQKAGIKEPKEPGANGPDKRRGAKGKALNAKNKKRTTKDKKQKTKIKKQ